MASVLQQYHQLADRMATQITGSYQSWTDFLTTAARLYKYPYHEQLMSWLGDSQKAIMPTSSVRTSTKPTFTIM